MPDPIQPSTYDDIGIDAYKEYDEMQRDLYPLIATKEKLVNVGVAQETISSIYANTIEEIVGQPFPKCFSNIAAPPGYSENLTSIFYQGSLTSMSRENLIDVDIDRINASDKLNSSEKQTATNMLKTLDSLSKLQENVYFETKRYSRG